MSRRLAAAVLSAVVAGAGLAGCSSSGSGTSAIGGGGEKISVRGTTTAEAGQRACSSLFDEMLTGPAKDGPWDVSDRLISTYSGKPELYRCAKKAAKVSFTIDESNPKGTWAIKVESFPLPNGMTEAELKARLAEISKRLTD